MMFLMNETMHIYDPDTKPHAVYSVTLSRHTTVVYNGIVMIIHQKVEFPKGRGLCNISYHTFKKCGCTNTRQISLSLYTVLIGIKHWKYAHNLTTLM